MNVDEIFNKIVVFIKVLIKFTRVLSYLKTVYQRNLNVKSVNNKQITKF